MEHVEVSGLRIAFRRSGAGPTLLLLHGAICDSRVWANEVEVFSRDFDVIAWDAPGCGGSDDPPARFRMDDFARSLLGFTDQLGLHRPHVLGHSWGTTLALEAWRQRPERVRSLILAGAYAGWAGSLPAEEVAVRLAFALRIARLPPRSWDPETMPGLFSAATPTEQRRMAIDVMRDIRPAGTSAMAHALAEADLRDVLSEIDVPTLLLQGEADERSPRHVGEALRAAIPGSRLELVPGAGHELFLDAGPACHGLVRSFIATIEDGSLERAHSAETGPISPPGRAAPQVP